MYNNNYNYRNDNNDNNYYNKIFQIYVSLNRYTKSLNDNDNNFFHICILYLWIATDKSVVMNENGKKKM